MKRPAMSDIGRSLIEIAWHFGPKGLNGECCEDLTMPEFIALDKVSTTPNCPVQEIGQALGFTKSGATRIVNRLERKGYIKKIKSPDDARYCCIGITRAGVQVLLSADTRYKEQFHIIASKISDYSLSDMAGMLTALAKSLKQ